MNNIDSLIFDIKKELYSEPIIQEFFRLKNIVENDKELNELNAQLKVQQKLMCDNLNNDSIYLTAKDKFESLNEQINNNPLMQNYIQIKDEVIGLLQEIKAELQWFLLLQDQHV